MEPGKIVHAVREHGESAKVVVVRILAPSERDHAAEVPADTWDVNTNKVVGDDTPGGAIFISSDEVFEDPEAANDALQRHRDAKKLKV